MTNILAVVFLPVMLLGLTNTKVASPLLVGIAGSHLMLGFFELNIPNLMDDAFAEIPNHLVLWERIAFFILPAVAAVLILRLRNMEPDALDRSS